MYVRADASDFPLQRKYALVVQSMLVTGAHVQQGVATYCDEVAAYYVV